MWTSSVSGGGGSGDVCVRSARGARNRSTKGDGGDDAADEQASRWTRRWRIGHPRWGCRWTPG